MERISRARTSEEGTTVDQRTSIVSLLLAGLIILSSLSCGGGTEGAGGGTESPDDNAGEASTAAARSEAGEPSRSGSAAQDGLPLRIPFELERNKIILPVRVGGSRALRVLLDTGMHFDGLLLYNRDLRDSLGIDDFIEVQVGGAGSDEASNAVVADSVTFSIGGAVLSGQRIIVLTGDRFEGFPSDGVSGYSLLGHYAVEIDYDSLFMTLHDPDGLSVDDSWQSISLAFKGNRIPWVEASISVDGGEEIPVSLYIDLASGEAVEMLIRDGMLFELPPGLEEVYLGRGLSGDVYGYRGEISSLRLGPFTLYDVLAAFADAEVRSKQPGADGVLANNALRRFNLIFDYTNERLFLKPNGHFDEPFE